MDFFSIFGPMSQVTVPAPTGAATVTAPLNNTAIPPAPVGASSVLTTEAAPAPAAPPKETKSNKNLYIGLAVALFILILMLGGGAYFMSAKNKNGVSA